MMDLTQKDMFEEVAKAAESGRYCHGNGAQWVLVGDDGLVVTIDTVLRKRVVSNGEESARYLAHTPAHRAVDVAESLRKFVLSN